MSKQQIDITKNVMSKIKSDQVRMRPRWYFWLGSFVLFLAIVGIMVISTFLISLITFSIRSHGPMGNIRYQQLISSFPWWAPVVVILGLAAGTILLKKYDFSYKKNFLFIIISIIAAVLVAGMLINILGLDSFLIKRGPMNRFYQQYGNEGRGERNGLFRNNGQWRKIEEMAK